MHGRRTFIALSRKAKKGIRILAPCPYTRMVETEKIDPHSKQTVRDANGNPIKGNSRRTKAGIQGRYRL